LGLAGEARLDHVPKQSKKNLNFEMIPVAKLGAPKRRRRSSIHGRNQTERGEQETMMALFAGPSEWLKYLPVTATLL
jgi:hypothetical protein